MKFVTDTFVAAVANVGKVFSRIGLNEEILVDSTDVVDNDDSDDIDDDDDSTLLYVATCA